MFFPVLAFEVRTPIIDVRPRPFFVVEVACVEGKGGAQNASNNYADLSPSSRFFNDEDIA